LHSFVDPFGMPPLVVDSLNNSPSGTSALLPALDVFVKSIDVVFSPVNAESSPVSSDVIVTKSMAGPHLVVFK